MIVISASTNQAPPVMEDSAAFTCPNTNNVVTLIEQHSSLSSIGSTEKKDPSSFPPPPPPPASPSSQRRAIFDKFWKKSASSLSFRDDNDSASATDTPTKQRNSVKVEPSYLGIYSFAPPSPLVSPKPVLCPLSDGSLTPSPGRPKSILRRHHSARVRVHPIEEEEGTDVKLRSLSACSASEMNHAKHASLLNLPFQEMIPPLPQLFQEDASNEEARSTDSISKESSCERSHSVHFDPTITVREVVGGSPEMKDAQSNWFSEDDLQTFFREAVHLCHASAINSIKTYSPPEVAKAHARAAQAGIKDPVCCSALPEYRALFAEPILHVTDEDAIVHDGSAAFFKIAYKMIRNVLIVDNCRATLELLQEHIMSMFPHVNVDLIKSGEDALARMEVDSSGAIVSHSYDVIIVDENLNGSLEVSEHKEDDSEHDLSIMTGSELLHRINQCESSKSLKEEDPNIKSGTKKRKSLMIGVSADLGEDCTSLQQGGADLLWSKPPPTPSNCLRNQLLNTLLSKRGKSVFICGC